MSGEVTDPDDGLGPGLMVGSPQSPSDGALLVSSFSDPFWNLQRSDVFLTETGVFPCTTLPFDLDELLVGQPLDGAWARPLDAGWEVRIDDLDDSTESFDADLRSDRVTIEHRGITVVAVTVG